MNYLIVLINLFIIIFLFYRAAGNLKIAKLNIISYTFYSILIFEFIGISLVYCGFSNHYLVNKVAGNYDVINKAYWSMVWVMIALSSTIILTNKYFYKIANINKRNSLNIDTKVDLSNKKMNHVVYKVCVVSLIVCLIATIYVFNKIGYVPLFKLFDSSFDYAVERIKSGRNFPGNEYIKNIVMLLLTPLLSYLSYIYMRTTHEKKWRYIFAISFILCLFVKTYDFSKAPIVYYIAYFFFIEIIIGNIKRFKVIIKYLVIIICLVVGMYLTVGKYNGNFLSLSNGPISRVIITQPGTLLLHFDAFPNKTPYLNGHSFPKIARFLLGEGEYGIRSGRKVMEIYKSDAIDAGTAGVMSTVFIGEAYANFGWFGVFIAPILVGFIISSAMCIYLKSSKNPLNVCLYVQTIIIVSTVTQAGFVDFIYNVSFAFILVFITFIKILCDKDYLKKMVETIKKRKVKLNDNVNQKRMIFHIPNYIDLNRKSGSNIRPYKMIQAFKNIGYSVDVVMGYGKERQQSIDEIENNILNGIKYDFLYSESSTMPTLLTEKHHIPTHPFLDFAFFRFCKKRNIKIALFYRDIHWKFPLYAKSVSKYKRHIAICFYKYDLYMYNKLLDIMYIPSQSFKKYIEDDIRIRIELLPPGAEVKNIIKNKFKDNIFHIFYVGGMQKDIYYFPILVKTVSQMHNVVLTICTRENEWENSKKEYQKYLNDNIKIVHTSGDGLTRYYEEADVCSLFIEPTDYMSMSIPIKTFEYISYQKPIICVKKTEVANFVEKNNIGFSVPYNGNSLKKLITKLKSNSDLLKEKTNNIVKILPLNTWNSRAEKVVKDLK